MISFVNVEQLLSFIWIPLQATHGLSIMWHLKKKKKSYEIPWINLYKYIPDLQVKVYFRYLIHLSSMVKKTRFILEMGSFESDNSRNWTMVRYLLCMETGWLSA